MVAALGSIFGSLIGNKIADSIFGSKPESEVTMAAGPFDYLQQKQSGQVAAASNTETQTSTLNEVGQNIIEGFGGFFSGQSAPAAQTAANLDIGTSQGGIPPVNTNQANLLSGGLNLAQRAIPFLGGFGAGALVDQGLDMVSQNGSTSPGRMTAIGILRLSPKGNLVITRRMKSKMKSLADSVGLEAAANIVGIDIRTASAILLKSFPSRERGVTGREIRQCRRVVNKMKHFYSMIPTRTSSSTRRTYGSKVTQIKN